MLARQYPTIPTHAISPLIKPLLMQLFILEAFLAYPTIPPTFSFAITSPSLVESIIAELKLFPIMPPVPPTDFPPPITSP